ELLRFEKAADHPRLVAAAAMIDGPHPVEGPALHEIRREQHLGRLAAPEFMRAREGQQDEVAGDQRAALAAGRLDGAAAADDQMKDADMPEMRHRHAGVVALGRQDAEGCREAGIEEHRAGEAHRTQHVRQEVGGSRSIGNGKRRPGHCVISSSAIDAGLGEAAQDRSPVNPQAKELSIWPSSSSRLPPPTPPAGAASSRNWVPGLPPPRRAATRPAAMSRATWRCCAKRAFSPSPYRASWAAPGSAASSSPPSCASLASIAPRQRWPSPCTAMWWRPPPGAGSTSRRRSRGS